uniref:RNA-directed DNA polymerase, eukaryota, reverse transcriptase zinc-binding domain protein n=1 Tax=Tanacetum cinerariifolium TaxID=118510 RepID=A0A6L2P4N3_TANCI|nr:RNA-directed DNA polymerase, eukaryota, reverse transcriptase zinc-binding domain protein [Tanacetum cinerariifolium]
MGELIFMDVSNSANKYSLRICVKTTFFHSIVESLKVIIKLKVYVVRAKEVIGWVLDFGEEKSDESEDYNDNTSVGKKNWVEFEEGEIIPKSVQNDAFIDNIAASEPINGDSHENQSGQHILKASNHPLGDPFGLEDLIYHYEYDKVEALRESTTPQDSKKVRNDQTFHQVLEESINKSSGVSKTTHVDSMAGPVKQRNGFSILERFQEFIDIGQAMGYKMKGCEKISGVLSLAWEISARGRSGGILYVWDKLLFHKKRTYATEHYLCVKGSFGITCWRPLIVGMVRSSLWVILMRGYLFTWSNKHASKMSKLDWFLVSQGMLDLFPNLTEDDFHSVIKDSWNNDGISASNSMILLKNKLKFLKQRLKEWSSIKRRNKDHDRKVIQDSLIKIDLLLDKGNGLSDDLTKRRKHKFHPRPDSSLYLSNEEPILGYLKFSAKGTKSKVFGMPIPDSLITVEIQQATYYHEYLEKEAEKVPTEEPQVADEDAYYQKAMKESMKDSYALPKSPLPPVVIREPESGKYQPLPEVPGKGNAKVIEEKVSHDLLSLQKHKKTSLADQYIFQRRVFEPTGSSRHDESLYALLGQSDNEEESEKVVLKAEEGGQDEDQDGPDPDAQAKDQTGLDADSSGAEAKVQSILSPVVHAGSDREHMDLDIANVSPQPSTEQLDEGFTATVYLNVQENLKLAVEEPVWLEEGASSSGTLSSLQHLKNLKLAVEEPVLLEEGASSSGTLSSLQHLSRDFSFGDQFFSDKLSDADKNAETKVESMVNVTVQQALSSISLMISPIIDLTSRPESPKENQQLKATTTDTTTTTTTTTLPPPQAPQQSTTKAIMVKRIGELEHILADLIQINKNIEERLDKHRARLYTLEQLDIPQQVSITSMNRDHSEELVQDLAEVHKKRKKSHESPKTPPGSPSHQPPHPPPPAGFATPSPSKSAASAEYQAWTTTDIRLRPSISLTPADLEMDEDMAPDEQAQSSDDEDIESAHIPTVNLRQGWWKPFEEERPTTPKPACKGRRRALSILKMKAAYYPDAGLEQMVPDQFWIEEECKYDIAAIVVRIEVFSMYGYDYIKMIVLRRAINEHVIAERDFKYLYLSDFEDMYLLNLQGHLNHLPPKDKKILTTAVNQSTRQLVIRHRVEDFQLGIESYQTQDKYEVQMMIRFNEIHKFSNGTLLQINEALDYRVKEYRINRLNPGLNTRFWTKKDVDRCNAFMFAIQRRLRTRRIFRNLESFVGERVREGDYRLLRSID